MGLIWPFNLAAFLVLHTVAVLALVAAAIF